ncbi:MAG: AAA family ATPase [Phycisphaerales bacterium]|nr:AAA family ATPase [Phycisphaerales bacterium]
MITDIRFDGYRLLDGFEADLSRLTVIVGANATGKSTLLDALSMVAHAMDVSLDKVIAARGGMWSVPSRGRECDEIGWTVEMTKPDWHPIWSKMPIADRSAVVYEARIGRSTAGEIVPRYECLRNAAPREGHSQPFKMLEVDSRGARVFQAASRKLVPFNQPASPGNGAAAGDAASAEPPESVSLQGDLTLSRMRFENEYPIPTWVRAYLANLLFYPGFDVRRSSAVRSRAAEIRRHAVLWADGENLGSVIHEILTQYELRDIAEELRETFRRAYPHVEDVRAETAYGGEPRVLVRTPESGQRGPTELWELSDGMLRFLLLFAALMNPARPALVAIDEPEAGLHPRLLPIIADVIKSASDRTQVIITTHSPQLVSAFGIDDVAVMGREGAQARWFRPGTRQSLRTLLESAVGPGIGDLHASGELDVLS